jgi:mevalonate kinase
MSSDGKINIFGEMPTFAEGKDKYPINDKSILNIDFSSILNSTHVSYTTYNMAEYIKNLCKNNDKNIKNIYDELNQISIENIQGLKIVNIPKINEMTGKIEEAFHNFKEKISSNNKLENILNDIFNHFVILYCLLLLESPNAPKPINSFMTNINDLYDHMMDIIRYRK